MTSTLVDQIRPFLRIEDEAFDDPRDTQGLRSKTRTSMDKDGVQRPRRLPLITAPRSSWRND